MSNDAWVRATYTIAVSGDPQRCADLIAGEQSAGTFTPVAGDSPELQEQFGARVVSLQPTGRHRAAARSYARRDSDEQVPEYELVIDYPASNIADSASHLMTVIAGNLFELREHAGLRVEALELPAATARAIATAPRERVTGGLLASRESMGRAQGPMLGTIVKPSVGLSNERVAELAAELAAAGLDLIKDDELNASLAHASVFDRIDRVQTALNGVDDNQTQYAYNITGTLDHMKRAADYITSRGGQTAMVVVPWIGLEAFAELRRNTPLVLQAHRAGWGALDRSADVGISFAVYAQVLRLLGADQIHVGGLRSKFWEHRESIVNSVDAVLQPSGPTAPALPVLSSAQTVLTAAESYQTFATEDLLVLAGGGIHAHPDGPVAGVSSLRLAWDAALAGVPLPEAAGADRRLASAVEHFGGLQ